MVKDLAMTYTEYCEKKAAYDAAVSKKKSLALKLRMNRAWLVAGSKSPRNLKRLAVIKQCQEELDALVVPHKPKQPRGYEILVEGTYEGFIAHENLQLAIQQAKEALGHDNFKLRIVKRYHD